MMRKFLPIVVGLLAACSNSAGNEAVAPCPADLLKTRDAETKAADIIVVGKWAAAGPDITPEIPVRVGNIKVTKSIRETLVDGDMVGILTSNIQDKAGRIVECGLSEPAGDKSYTFYINQNTRSLQVIAYK